MSAKPILFSGPMVRALLDGRKTMTRRVLNPQPESLVDRDGGALQVGLLHVEGEPLPRITQGRCITRQQVRFAPGDLLWVRETWRCNGWASDLATIMYGASKGDGYTAMTEQYPVEGKTPVRVTGKWRPSIHMPRWASRITLAVTAVKVERLQDISEADAEAEGAAPVLVPPDGGSAPHVEGFRALWNSINGPAAWDANPWVAAVSFDGHHVNVDAKGAE